MKVSHFTLFFTVASLLFISSVASAMTFSVTNNADSGPGSLRDAINNANANPGQDLIDFPNQSYNIILTSQLPALTDNAGVIIDGYLPAGAGSTPNTNPQGQPSNAVLKVIITASVPYSMYGIYIYSRNNTIRGLVINNFYGGIVIDGSIDEAYNNFIIGCYIGTNISGTAAVPNNIGILLTNGTGNSWSSNYIGDGTNGGRNLISGNNWYGIEISGIGTEYNQVQGNYIGTNVNGTAALGNIWSGIRIQGGASYNMIGSQINLLPQVYRNIISGNGFASPNPVNYDGIDILDGGTMNNTVSYNFIGTDCTGNNPIPNGLYGVGIFNGASNNTIAGDILSGLYTVISGNTAGGVWIEGSGTNGNIIDIAYIGLNAAGTAALANQGHGVHVSNSAQLNNIGNTWMGALHISGNLGDGIRIEGPGTNNNLVRQVTIGSTVGNSGNGIHILNGPQFTQIGGNHMEYNSIYNNALNGILIDNAQNNSVLSTSFIFNEIKNNGGDGIAVVNPNSLGNTFSLNIIDNNGGLGIDLNNDGVTLNDTGDPDIGPNKLLNYPVISSATAIPGGGGNQVQVTGTLNIEANPELATVEVYVANPQDPSGYGEAVYPMGFTTPSTTGTWSLLSGVSLNPGDYVTALTIDQYGNTSELSLNVIVTEAPPQYDYSDAPDPPYPTLIANNGAGHAIVSGGPFLGNPLDFPDAESDGLPFLQPLAMGDDLTGNDDENGVIFNTPLYAGMSATLTIEVQNGPAWVDAWIDFNGNGIWGDMGGTEYILSGQFLPGINVILVFVPANATAQLTYARFRINSSGPLQPTGIAADGEVEDYDIPLSVLWVGGTPGAETDWSNPLNWSNGIVPTSGDDIVIGGNTNNNPIISGTASCDDILIEDGAILNLSTGANFTANGNMTIGQGTSGSLKVNGGTGMVVGTTTVNPGGTLVVYSGTFTP